MDTGVRDIERFIIGDEGYRRYYGAGRRGAGIGGAACAPGSSRGAQFAAAGERRIARGAAREWPGMGGDEVRARVLVHDGPGPIGAHIYYPDALIRRLEREPPSRGLGESNIDPFAVFVEELDHFLLIAERARLRRPVSLFELELHADVTKYLVCALFRASGREARKPVHLEESERLWLFWHLFEKSECAEADPRVRTRYKDAARYARKFLTLLSGERSAAGRIALLRSFHDATAQQKIAILG